MISPREISPNIFHLHGHTGLGRQLHRLSIHQLGIMSPAAKRAKQAFRNQSEWWNAYVVSQFVVERAPKRDKTNETHCNWSTVVVNLHVPKFAFFDLAVKRSPSLQFQPAAGKHVFQQRCKSLSTSLRQTLSGIDCLNLYSISLTDASNAS